MIVVDQPDALMDVPVAIELKEFTPAESEHSVKAVFYQWNTLR